MSTTEITLQGITYHLVPNNHLAIAQTYDQQQGYDSLHRFAQAQMQRPIQPELDLVQQHGDILRKSFPKELCDNLILEINNDPQSVQHPDVLKILLPFIFTDTVDLAIRSYFNSEYCLFWYDFYAVNDIESDDKYYKKWHCDGGPDQHLKILIYLNDHQEHASDTLFYDHDTTQKLKDIGYIFGDLNHRQTNLAPLLAHHGIHGDYSTCQPSTGDLILFNPLKLAHKARVSQTGKTRYVFTACLVPSPLHWQTILEQHYFPKYQCQSFEGFATKLLSFVQQPKQTTELIELGLGHTIGSTTHLQWVLSAIFHDDKLFAEQIFQNILRQDPKLEQIKDLATLFNVLKEQIYNSIQVQTLVVDNIHKLQQLAEYDQRYVHSITRYANHNKPNVNAIFWPIPTHPKHPQNKFDLLPFVQSHQLMDFDTPIGSAGSCFAFEIARILQQEQFNYVVTERNDDPESGIIIDGYQPGDLYARFSANYGILFNTPSFLQLAQKAFAERHFNKVLIPIEQGGFFDPYRENVIFLNQDAYLADYERHINAVREAFLQSKVFIITLGLNECWQFHDGTVMSRNPRENIYHLVKHKTLTVQENVDNIQSFFNIIRQHNPDFKLLISLSPIPFLATGRAETHHVIEANTHSKAVLRVAADELVQKNKDIYYLPSYELVTECIANAWQPDHRHVTPETVAQVIHLFKAMFVSQKV